ncbi:hypothetical protein [Haloferula sargassicola]|uniref:DUF4878 domain-containing protein n=1 Tax=Haloferula sargassicola TaxID=490096 RepID=A0ABP9UL52_9BACT
MKTLLSLVVPFALVASIHAEDEQGVQELGKTYVKLFNAGKVSELMSHCLDQTGVTEEMKAMTQAALGDGGTISRFELEEPKEKDKALFSEGQDVPGYGRLFLNLEPQKVIVFHMEAKGGRPASSQRSLAGKMDGKWKLAMLVPQKKG